MFRFVHTSDLHLGKRFGQLPEELRSRLTEARHGSIGRLVSLAKTHDAKFIFVAGDVFDTETPSLSTLRQALSAMGKEPSVGWVLLPGNHDSLAADELWAGVARYRPENVILALRPEPVTLNPNVVLLPAPCSTRRPGRDLTSWMENADIPAEALRIGLAHGAVASFGEDGAENVIAPDRAERARLDYLALGDWHGQMRITDRAWYSGTPEPDRFKHDAPGSALVVSLDGSGAPPVVMQAETGEFNWTTLSLSLLPGEDAASHLVAALPDATRRRQTLLKVVADGRARLPEITALSSAATEAEPDFSWFELDASSVRLDCEIEDLDFIDQGGALRHAAETLLANARSEALTTNERDVARMALSRLYSYALETS